MGLRVVTTAPIPHRGRHVYGGLDTLAGMFAFAHVPAGRYLKMAGSSGTAQFTANNQMRAGVLYIPVTMTLDRVGLEVATIGDVGSTIRLALYADDGNGFPAGLLLDAGSIASDTTGVKEITVSLTVSGPTVLWVAAIQQGAAAVRSTPATIGGPTFPHQQETNGVRGPSGWVAGGVAAGAPDPFPAGATAAGFVAQCFVRRTP